MFSDDATTTQAPEPKYVVIVLSDEVLLEQINGRSFDCDGVEVRNIRHADFQASELSALNGCVVLDTFPDPSGCLAVLERLRPFSHRLPVIVLANGASLRLAVNAMKTGAFDVLEKPVNRTQLETAMRDALRSVRSFAPSNEAVEEPPARRVARDALASLTPRQRDIVAHIMQGQPNKNIAADLGISQRTAENHRAAIMRKMGVSSISALVQKTLAAS
jgi:two-component system CheB/CheR fusion protein